GARALLDQEEFSAGVIGTAAAQDAGKLQREGHLAVKVLVQAVEASGFVAQEERCRLRLAGAAADRQQASQGRREAAALSEGLHPVVGNRRQARIDARAQPAHQGRQRVSEILVLTQAESEALHVDTAAETGVVLVEKDQSGAS